MKELIVLLPAYNEEKEIRKLVTTWSQYKHILKDDYELNLKIVAINDGSKDDTERIAMELEEEFDYFTLVNHECNKGLGEAVKTGFKYVLAQTKEVEYACLMDCDNTQHPKYVLDMLKKIKHNENGTDVVIEIGRAHV